MPNRKTYKGKKVYRKRKGTTVQQVVKVLRGVAEKKRCLIDIDDAGSAREVDFSGHRFYLDTIAQGAGEGERVGRIVTPSSFVAKVKIFNIATSSTHNNVAWTAFLVQDTQCVGDSHAAVSEIISNVGTPLAPMGLINAANKGRFRMLKRWTGMLGYSASGVSSSRYLDLYYYFSKPNNIRYNGTASTDIEANSLMLVFVTDRDPGDNAVYVHGVARLWYSDV